MNVDWRELLWRVLDDDALTDAEAEVLAQALADPDTRREAAEWMRLEAGLHSALAPEREADVGLSRERLLAKAALRQKARATRVRARRIGLLAAAAAVLLAAVIGWRLKRDRHQELRLEGDARITRDGVPVARAHEIRRGDRLVVGPLGAKLTLGGYCRLNLDSNCELVLAGLPRKEVIELEVGRVVSSVDPHVGRFRITTVLGTIDVAGTKFVAAVRSLPRKGAGQMSPSMRKLSTVVTVTVIAGAVAYQFGDATGLLNAGMSQAFAAENPGLPDGLKGFCGMVVGKIISKGEREFVLKVEKVIRVWKNNKAKEPESAVGKELTLKIRRRSKAMVEALAGLKVGDRVVAEALNLEGDILVCVETLRKATDELLKKLRKP